MHWPSAGIIISILILKFVIVLLTERGIQAVIVIIAGKFRIPYKTVSQSETNSVMVKGWPEIDA